MLRQTSCVKRRFATVLTFDVSRLTPHASRSNKYATNASCSRKSGTIMSAPASISRLRFHASMPLRFASSEATPTAMPPTCFVSSISTKPSPNATNSGPDRWFSAMMRSIRIFLEKLL